FEVGIAHDDPLEPERVALPVELRAGVGRDALKQLLDVLLDLRELAGGERLEDDGADAGRLQPAFDLERHTCGREREESLARRLLQLLAPEEDVAEAQVTAAAPARFRPIRSASTGRRRRPRPSASPAPGRPGS